MNIPIKTSSDLIKMRTVCKLAKEVLDMINNHVKPGVSTDELNSICHQYITKKQNAIPAALGYKGFPKSVCISVNNVVCHGIPSKKKILKFGDIVNIDVAIFKNGFYGDTSKMFFVGKPSTLGYRLCQITEKSLYKAINLIHPGIDIKIIGSTIQKYIEFNKFSVVKEFCGHGIGKEFHEFPQILHYDNKYIPSVILKSGMTFTIEPMVNAGSESIKIMQDKWTVKTKDHSLSAQYEHTIAVTKDGYEILTL